MKNDQSERSGRSLPCGPALGTILLVAASAALGACGGGNNERATEADSGPASEAGSPESGNGSNSQRTDGSAPDSGGGASADGGGSDGPSGGSGQIGTIVKAANDSSFHSPFDATPSPDGSTIYFTAIAADGTGAVFSSPASGGGATRIDSGGVLITPSGITVSPDGDQLFIADSAVDDQASERYGAILVIPVAGGMPTILAGTQGTRPRGVAIAGPTLFFTAAGGASGSPGVYSIPVAGGQVTTIASGPPFADPSGIAIAKNGDAYVSDSTASPSKIAAVVKVSGGSATTLVMDLGVGYPAGLALTQDESAVLVSGLDPTTQTDVVYRITLGATPQTAMFNQTISAFSEPAGLHRAASAEIYAWADSLANGTGTVYALSK
jgi:sugar lactone lactonase YvrE